MTGVGRDAAPHFGSHSRRTAAGHPGGAPGDVELKAAFPGDERVERALAGLHAASRACARRLLSCIRPFGAGRIGCRGAAVAAYTEQRSGIEVGTDIDYPVRNEIDPIVFAQCANCCPTWCTTRGPSTRRSRSNNRRQVCFECRRRRGRIRQRDDGAPARRGHIGLASHRTRVEAAGGEFVFSMPPWALTSAWRYPEAVSRVT